MYVFNLADDCRCLDEGSRKIIARHINSRTYDANSGVPSAHKLAVLVPYRDRFEELLAFAPYLHDFLNKQEVSHRIYILNQVHILRILVFYHCQHVVRSFKLIHSIWRTEELPSTVERVNHYTYA